LRINTAGFNNTANGVSTLFANLSGNNNTATGAFALQNSTTGDENTGHGVNALAASTTGDGNTAVGFGALFANTTGSQNIGIGNGAGINVTNVSNVIAIGTGGANVSNSCYIGQIYTNIQPQVGTDPDFVTINSDGRLGRANISSRRYKHDIQPMHTASEAIYALKPVSFRYQKQYDRTQTIAFGLIAEEVAAVNPDLVGRDREGQPESVRYEQINAMLLNKFLKEHRKGEEQDCKIQEQETTIAELRHEIQALAVLVNEQASELQKVSAWIRINNAGPRVTAK
jgi:trimeric autotransporter adhesin